MPLLRFILVALGLSIATPALSHVTLEQSSAATASYHKAVFRIGHGCEGSPTVRLEITIPEGIVGVKPMPKSGWNLLIRRAKLKTPYQSHGKTVSEDVNEVIWDGGLLRDDFYDEFVLSLRTPDSPGPVYFKVVQICEKGRLDWVELPIPGEAQQKLLRPAVLLEILPAELKPHH